MPIRQGNLARGRDCSWSQKRARNWRTKINVLQLQVKELLGSDSDEEEDLDVAIPGRVGRVVNLLREGDLRDGKGLFLRKVAVIFRWELWLSPLLFFLVRLGLVTSGRRVWIFLPFLGVVVFFSCYIHVLFISLLLLILSPK